ncbi:MAG: aminotransferase class I/II-fold pyridoxal phosphate-dependent enzyme [Gemmatimonadota bacterium]|nr:aminotransferase class I/II-fold pyridoxal phosphate-dependent enzyme [Gemmatimonadota bacterium]
MHADRVVDLRSDTVTRPSAPMRQAMATADVGDDVLDGDPTTRRLEERIADLTGFEASLFFPSGVQANQVAVWLHTEPGTEVILEANAHLVHYEMAGVAGLSGAQIRPVTTDDGVLTAEHVDAAWRPVSPHVPRISLVCAENTHNAAGGKVMPLDVWDAIAGLAADRGVPLHLDGARVWHAAAALDAAPSRLTKGAATVMVSLSKGLGCPVGSCLAGSADLIHSAWEVRRRFGGAMRQSGILAAAGLYALEHNLTRLSEDHAHASLLAERLGDHTAIAPLPPDTNIVMLDLVRSGDSADTVLPKLAEHGVMLVPFGPRRLRAVTHLDVSHADVEWAADVIGRVLA